jgi:hypothetical protein
MRWIYQHFLEIVTTVKVQRGTGPSFEFEREERLELHT